MPSGAAHETINTVVLAGVGTGYYYYYAPIAWDNPLIWSFLAAYLIGTFLITPDLDLATQSVRPKQRWGPLGWIWVPYGRLFSHRGLSHSWILGPGTRVLYLLALAAAVMGLLDWALAQAGREFIPAWSWQRQVPPALLSGVAGYYLSQWIHLTADRVPLRL